MCDESTPSKQSSQPSGAGAHGGEHRLQDELSSRYALEPAAADNYEGRQYGWVLTLDGVPVLRCTTGGTGPCWNVQEALPSVHDGNGGMEPAIDAHVCDLDELIGALQFLRDSDAHEGNVQRWAL